MMRRHTWYVLLLAGLLLHPLAALAQEVKITQDLQDRIAAVGQAELIPVLISFEEAMQFTEAEQKNIRAMTKGDRRSLVAQKVTEFARKNQKGVVNIIKGFEARGQAQRVQVLEVANVIAAHLPAEAIGRIAARTEIRRIKWDRTIPIERVLDDAPEHDSFSEDFHGAALPVPGVSAQSIGWGIEKIRADDVWALGYTGQGVLVAVLDNGFDYNHPDLNDHLWNGSAFSYQGQQLTHHGWDTVNDDNDPYDNNVSHGTRTAGIVAGDGTNGASTGVAPDATLMLIRNLTGVESDVMAGFDFLFDMKYAYPGSFPMPNIVNMSGTWGFLNEPSYNAWRVISYNLLWAGVLHVNSAGNTGDGEELDDNPIPYNVGAPANSPSAWRHWDQEYDGCGWVKCHSPYGATMAVGAVIENDVLFDQSSLGPSAWEDIQANHSEQQSIALDKRDYRYETSPYDTPLIKPDVVAPSGVISTNPGDNYGLHTATSSATAHVSGAAALMLSEDPTLTVEEITEKLETTAKALGASGKDYEYGSGRIDVYKAITFGSPKRGTPEATASATPQTYLLHENFPDPFNPSTRVQFDLPEAVQVSLVVYDVMGREVARLIDKRSMAAGTHAVTWEASGLPSGVYLYQLTAGAYRQTKSMTLLK